MAPKVRAAHRPAIARCLIRSPPPKVAAASVIAAPPSMGKAALAGGSSRPQVRRLGQEPVAQLEDPRQLGTIGAPDEVVAGLDADLADKGADQAALAQVAFGQAAAGQGHADAV